MKRVIFIYLFLPILILNAQDVLDKIVAVVDNEIITLSELDNETYFFAVQRNLDPSSSEVKKQVLNFKIEEKLLYAQAELDSIIVSDEEVEGRIEGQLAFFIQQYGSAERIEQAYGMSIDRIKREMREDTRKNLMVQMLRQKKFGDIDLTRSEVISFYESHKDSLPLIPEKFKISHIFINPKATDKVKEEARQLARSLIDSVKAGADFGELANKYSDDPGSKNNGGDLGFVKRGKFLAEFEAAAYALSPGELSDVVETAFGYHVIQLMERRGESIHARHILIKPKFDDEADLNAIQFLSDLRDSVLDETNTFEYYATKYSDDEESSKFGGDLGSFEVSQLDKDLTNIVFKLKEDQVSYPKRLDLENGSYGFHIVRLDKKNPEHKPDIEQDYDEIKRLVEYDKREHLYNNWIKELKEKIYWEIRL